MSGAREVAGDSTTATGADRLPGPGVVATDRQTDTDDARCLRRPGACRSGRALAPLTGEALDRSGGSGVGDARTDQLTQGADGAAQRWKTISKHRARRER